MRTVCHVSSLGVVLADDDAFDKLFSSLDKAEAILAKNRYLCGDSFTEADIRFFTTLIRFDAVYHGWFCM